MAEAGADLRPDEQITEHLRGLAQVLPPLTRAAAARLSDEDLAARWQTAMAFSLGRDPGQPIEFGFHTEIEVGRDGGSPRVRGHHANLPAAAVSAPLLEAAAVIEELDRRVEAKVQAAIADPPTYILHALGSWPHDAGASALWEVEAVEIEQYRLVTGTSDPIHPLGPPEPPGNSWRECWWRALTQDLAQCGSTWMRYRHSVFGSAEEHADVADVIASATDPRLSARPDTAMLAEQENLPTSTLRSWVVHPAALLAGSWPPSRSGELAAARGRHVELERYAQEQRLLLDAARPGGRGLVRPSRHVPGLPERPSRRSSASTTRPWGASTSGSPTPPTRSLGSSGPRTRTLLGAPSMAGWSRGVRRPPRCCRPVRTGSSMSWSSTRQRTCWSNSARHHTESLAHELDRGRALPGPDDPPGAINEW